MFKIRETHLASKLSKPAAGYLSAKLIGTEQIGTACHKCRDFIKSSNECLILTDPAVDAEHGTCTAFLRGEPYTNAKPLRLVSKEVMGYVEGEGVPTFCGQCEYYTEHGRLSGECEKVEGVIDYGACCNLYEYAKAD
jgi:hypothetical protein